jgi:hypothetical protein
MCGWKLSDGNLMVEGTSDVAYFKLAARLYRTRAGLSLLGQDFSIFAAGLGNEGGTYGVSEKFPTLFNLASYDQDAAGRRRFKVIALLDDDRMGQAALTGITRGHRQIREYESIFRLRRLMPQRAGSLMDCVADSSNPCRSPSSDQPRRPGQGHIVTGPSRASGACANSRSGMQPSTM